VFKKEQFLEGNGMFTIANLYYVKNIAYFVSM